MNKSSKYIERQNLCLHLTDMSMTPSTGFCRVRFLNAVSCDPFCIFIGSTRVDSNLKYSHMTEYLDIREGFKTVTIINSSLPRMILYRREILFNSGDIVTLSIINTLRNIDILYISDLYSLNNIGNMGGIRMANLVFDSPPFSLLIGNRKSVFSDVIYKQMTMYKRAMPKEYKFYLVQTHYNVRDCNIELCDDKTLTFMPTSQNISEFFLNIDPNVMYTIYVIGRWAKSMLIKVVDNL